MDLSSGRNNMFKKVQTSLSTIQTFCNILENYLRHPIHNSNKLEYKVIVTKLKISGFISEEKDQEIRAKWSNDNIARLEELILSCKLNSLDTLKVIIQGVYACGEVDLGRVLSESCFPASLRPALSVPEILTKVLKYLPPRDLANARRVCKTWNSLANQFVGKSFEIVFTSRLPNQLVEFVSSNTGFCHSLRKYNFKTRSENFANEKQHYLQFLKKFGHSIKQLTLSSETYGAVSEFFLSKEKFLAGLKSLILSVSLDQNFVQQKCNFSGLQQGNLQHLSVNSPQQRSEYGQMEFLNKFFQSRSSLKSLSLSNHYCVGDDITNFFKHAIVNSDLEILDANIAIVNMSDKQFIDLTAGHQPSTTTTTLKELNIPRVFGSNITPNILYRLLLSHKQSLQRLRFDYDENLFGARFGSELLEAIPDLPQLLHFNVRVQGLLSLNFCNHTPNLRKLFISSFSSVSNDVAVVENPSITSLWLKPEMSANAVSILKQISTCFPSLKKVVMKKVYPYRLGSKDDIRIEFSVRSTGFKMNLSSPSFVKQVDQGELNDVDRSYLSKNMPLVDQIKTILVKEYATFKTVYTDVRPTANVEIVCLLSSKSISYSELRKCGDTSKLWNSGLYSVVKISNGDIPTFFISKTPR